MKKRGVVGIRWFGLVWGCDSFLDKVILKLWGFWRIERFLEEVEGRGERVRFWGAVSRSLVFGLEVEVGLGGVNYLVYKYWFCYL